MHTPQDVLQLQDVSTSSNQFTWYNFRICGLIALAPLAFGYCVSIVGSTLGQPSFLLYMHLVDPETILPTKHASALEGAMSSVFFAGAVCGVLTSSFVIDKWGRRTGILFCSTFSIIGNVLCCAAQNPGMFIAGRFILGFGANAFVPVAGVYSSELAPPALRGFFGGLNGVMILLGYSLSSYMGLAFFHASDPILQWRTPLGLGLIPPMVMLLLLPTLPESPRWLLMQDRFEDAEKIVQRLHRGRKESNFGRTEFALMRIQAEQDKTMDSSWRVLLTRPSYRKRAMIAMLIGILGQASGVTAINNFSPLIYSTLGFGPEETLILLCGWISGGIFASLIGARLMDKWGRRRLIIFGFTGTCLCLIIFAVMIALFATPVPASPNMAAMGTAVAMLYLFIWIFSACQDNALVVYLPEIFPNHLRGKGVALGIAALDVTDIILLQVTPVAIRTIGWRYYLVFICVSATAVVWAWFQVPETKGLPLEKIAELFGEPTEQVHAVLEDKDRHVEQVEDTGAAKHGV